MLKDKKISIISLREAVDEDGFPIYNEVGEEVQIEAPIPGGENIWAYYRHVTGNEFYEAAKVNAKEEALFIINWRDDIDTTMKIKFRNKIYNITRIDDFEGYKKDLKIYAYKVN